MADDALAMLTARELFPHFLNLKVGGDPKSSVEESFTYTNSVDVEIFLSQILKSCLATDCYEEPAHYLNFILEEANCAINAIEQLIERFETFKIEQLNSGARAYNNPGYKGTK